MSKIKFYEQELGKLNSWDNYLLENSGLPGPRANIELAQAVAEIGERDLFLRYLSHTPELAPTGSPEEMLPFCGILGLGRLLAEGDETVLPILKRHANDPRWRIREAVAMALQRWGDADVHGLLMEMTRWGKGSLLERRAAVAALCEPGLLEQQAVALQVLQLLDQVSADIMDVEDRHCDDFIALRKGLGYCWSVAVVAAPEQGMRMMERWIESKDKDIRWVMKQNLGKKRLQRLDPEWVEVLKLILLKVNEC